MSKSDLDIKRERAAKAVESIAPHIREIIAMADETKVDLILMAIGGEKLPAEAAE